MAYNEMLEKRLQAAFAVFPPEVTRHIAPKKMFGGLAFLYRGKMSVGITKDDLMVRVVAEKMDRVLAMDHVRPMDFTNRPMKEFIFVAEGGYRTEAQLLEWIELGLEHARTKVKSK